MALVVMPVPVRVIWVGSVTDSHLVSLVVAVSGIMVFEFLMPSTLVVVMLLFPLCYGPTRWGVGFHLSRVCGVARLPRGVFMRVAFYAIRIALIVAFELVFAPLGWKYIATVLSASPLAIFTTLEGKVAALVQALGTSTRFHN